MLDGSHVRRTAEVCIAALAPTATADWAVAVPGMEHTAASVVAHAAETCLWYAIDLAAAGVDLEPVEHRVQPDHRPEDLLATLGAYAAVVAAVVDATAPTVRGFHPMGAADPSGFAGMACDEILLHTDDAARALGTAFEPPADLADAVLRRLFPWVGAGAADDPWALLRWANGRLALDDRPQLTRWRWHCAPLADWDGQRPAEITSG